MFTDKNDRYVTVLNQIFELGLTPSQLSVLVVIESFADSSRTSTPGFEEIGKRCNMSESHVKRTVNVLLSKGLIQKKIRPAGVKNLTNMYLMRGLDIQCQLKKHLTLEKRQELEVEVTSIISSNKNKQAVLKDRWSTCQSTINTKYLGRLELAKMFGTIKDSAALDEEENDNGRDMESGSPTNKDGTSSGAVPSTEVGNVKCLRIYPTREQDDRKGEGGGEVVEFGELSIKGDPPLGWPPRKGGGQNKGTTDDNRPAKEEARQISASLTVATTEASRGQAELNIETPQPKEKVETEEEIRMAYKAKTAEEDKKAAEMDRRARAEPLFKKGVKTLDEMKELLLDADKSVEKDRGSSRLPPKEKEIPADQPFPLGYKRMDDFAFVNHYANKSDPPPTYQPVVEKKEVTLDTFDSISEYIATHFKPENPVEADKIWKRRSDLWEEEHPDCADNMPFPPSVRWMTPDDIPNGRVAAPPEEELGNHAEMIERRNRSLEESREEMLRNKALGILAPTDDAIVK
jgi:DNA-binding MarR family transcriptional regulator